MLLGAGEFEGAVEIVGGFAVAVVYLPEDGRVVGCGVGPTDGGGTAGGGRGEPCAEKQTIKL